MKRFFFTLIALAAVAVSCTKSGLLESPQTYETPITFEPYTGKAPATKAAAVVTKDIATAGFRVFGFDATSSALYLNRVVKSTDEGTTWDYQVPMYWQENQSLRFAAYGLNVNPGTTVATNTGDIAGEPEGSAFVQKSTTPTSADYKKFTYTVPRTVSDQKDLVISPYTSAMTSASGTISINLHHVLSRVGFQLQLEGETGVNVIIKNLSLVGTGASTAEFDLTNSVTVTPAVGDTPESIAYAKTLGTTGTITYSLFDSAYEHDGTNNGQTYPGFIVTSDTYDAAKEEAKTHLVPICPNTTFFPDSEGVTYNPGDIDDDDITAPNATTLANRYMMFLPQTFTDASIVVVYQLEDAEEQEAILPLTTAFLPGKAYEFVFSVSTNSVGFGVTVSPWDEQADKDYPMN